MKSKPWYLSRTLWLAILQAIAGIILALLTVNPDLQQVGWLMLAKSGLDGVLRLLTEKPIQ